MTPVATSAALVPGDVRAPRAPKAAGPDGFSAVLSTVGSPPATAKAAAGTTADAAVAGRQSDTQDEPGDRRQPNEAAPDAAAVLALMRAALAVASAPGAPAVAAVGQKVGPPEPAAPAALTTVIATMGQSGAEQTAAPPPGGPARPTDTSAGPAPDAPPAPAPSADPHGAVAQRSGKPGPVVQAVAGQAQGARARGAQAQGALAPDGASQGEDPQGGDTATVQSPEPRQDVPVHDAQVRHAPLSKDRIGAAPAADDDATRVPDPSTQTFGLQTLGVPTANVPAPNAPAPNVQAPSGQAAGTVPATLHAAQPLSALRTQASPLASAPAPSMSPSDGRSADRPTAAPAAMTAAVDVVPDTTPVPASAGGSVPSRPGAGDAGTIQAQASDEPLAATRPAGTPLTRSMPPADGPVSSQPTASDAGMTPTPAAVVAAPTSGHRPDPNRAPTTDNAHDGDDDLSDASPLAATVAVAAPAAPIGGSVSTAGMAAPIAAVVAGVAPGHATRPAPAAGVASKPMTASTVSPVSAQPSDPDSAPASGASHNRDGVGPAAPPLAETVSVTTPVTTRSGTAATAGAPAQASLPPAAGKAQATVQAASPPSAQPPNPDSGLALTDSRSDGDRITMPVLATASIEASAATGSGSVATEGAVVQVADLLRGIVLDNSPHAPSAAAPATTPASPTPAATPQPATPAPQTVTLVLSPPTLGRVTVTVRMRSSTLDVKIAVENKDTLGLLAADRPLLTAALGPGQGTLDIAYVPGDRNAAPAQDGGTGTRQDGQARNRNAPSDPSNPNGTSHDAAPTAPHRDGGLYL